MTKICKICGIEKNLFDFYSYYRYGKECHINECKKCVSIKNRLLREKAGYVRPYIKKNKPKPQPQQKQLTDEIRLFLKMIEDNRFQIDYVDAYKLTNYFIDVYGNDDKQRPMEIKVELNYYFNMLLELL